MRLQYHNSGRMFLSILTLFVVISLTACTGKLEHEDKEDVGEKDNGKINVVTTIFPIYDFTRAVVGDNANLTMLISPGASIHSYDPSPGDIKRIGEANVFIHVGGESEAWVERILSSDEFSQLDRIRLIDHVGSVEEELKEGMESDRDHEEESNWEEETDQEEGTEYDEHIWTSPENAIKMIRAIAEFLGGVDPEHADLYRENAQTYMDEMQKLDEEVKEVVQTAKRKKIVVADRFPFRYFVDLYGLDYCAAFGGCSDQSDAGVATIAYLVNAVKNENMPYIYYVELSNKNVANSVGEQTGAELLLLHSCQNVTKEEWEEGVTYVSLMRNNLKNLKKGLN